jgi:hypothetical protein
MQITCEIVKVHGVSRLLALASTTRRNFARLKWYHGIVIAAYTCWVFSGLAVSSPPRLRTPLRLT